MQIFGWIADGDQPPSRWDLRDEGWHLCEGRDGCRSECRHVLICDVRTLTPRQRRLMAEADRPAWRLIMLGVEDPAERGDLLGLGVAEALPELTDLYELRARTRRVGDMFGMLPRWRNLGALTLDLFHRDARHGAKWLSLHPREFGLLWRLADTPGEKVTRQQLLKDVWRINHDPETNSVEVHVSRLRSKLSGVGCDGLVETAPGGGYLLASASPALLHARPAEGDALDAYLKELGWAAPD